MYRLVILAVCLLEPCMVLAQGGCSSSNGNVSVGQSFINQECTSRCTCQPGGQISCVDLCDPTNPSCTQGFVSRNFTDNVPDTNCSCESTRCIPEQCFDQNGVYLLDEEFISPDCSLRCTCQSGGNVPCVSLCGVNGATTCKSDEVLENFRSQVAGSNCSCSKSVCVPAQCQRNGTYSTGTSFIPSTCDRRCTCGPDGIINCVSLCPPSLTPTCTDGQVLVDFKVPADSSDQCTCTKKKCVQTECRANNGSILVDKTFTHLNCQQRCTCRPGGQLSCVSLCPPVQVVCRAGEVEEDFKEPVRDSNCTCDRKRCIPAPTTLPTCGPPPINCQLPLVIDVDQNGCPVCVDKGTEAPTTTNTTGPRTDPTVVNTTVPPEPDTDPPVVNTTSLPGPDTDPPVVITTAPSGPAPTTLPSCGPPINCQLPLVIGVDQNGCPVCVDKGTEAPTTTNTTGPRTDPTVVNTTVPPEPDTDPAVVNTTVPPGPDTDPPVVITTAPSGPVGPGTDPKVVKPTTPNGNGTDPKVVKPTTPKGNGTDPKVKPTTPNGNGTDPKVKPTVPGKPGKGPVCRKTISCDSPFESDKDAGGCAICAYKGYCPPREKCLYEEKSLVCGSNGVTYDNLCFLIRDSCLNNEHVTPVSKGYCPDNPCAKLKCGYYEICLIEGDKAKCVCPDCPPSSQYDAVCGSDGYTYSSECALRLMACTSDSKIKLKHLYPCNGHCHSTKCSNPYSKCHEIDSHKATCECPRHCPKDYDPVCGSDGKTYPNECVLERASCRDDKLIEIVRGGKCHVDDHPCDEYYCEDRYAYCTVERGNPVCKCPDSCGYNLQPVCGSDGKTYDNACHLEKYSCNSGNYISIKYEGYCSDKCPSNYQCPKPYAKCVLRGGRPSCYCDTKCKTNATNVCGSDGRTYSSDCGLRFVSCFKGVHIKIVPPHHCSKSGTTCNGVVCKPYGKCVNGQCSCPKFCTKIFSPVCGSDGQTYSNKCLMEVEACEKDKKITVVSNSACPTCSCSRPYGSCKVIKGKNSCSCDLQKICHASTRQFPQHHGPVCGWVARYRQRKTFSSECGLKVMSCFKNIHIRVLHKGPCLNLGR